MIVYTAAILNQSASLPSGIVYEDQYAYLTSQIEGSKRILLVLRVSPTTNKIIIENAATSSYYGGSVVSASYALSSSWSNNAKTATSASYATNAATAISSSYATNATYALTASYIPPKTGDTRFELVSKKLEYYSASIWVKV